jgi:hypothetical protein
VRAFTPFQTNLFLKSSTIHTGKNEQSTGTYPPLSAHMIRLLKDHPKPETPTLKGHTKPIFRRKITKSASANCSLIWNVLLIRFISALTA